MSDMRIGGCSACGGYTENDSDPNCSLCGPRRRKAATKAVCPDCLELAKLVRDHWGRGDASIVIDAFISQREKP